jgi:hypothetical protein
MIVIGYQGIGKSSAASDNLSFIDLESSSFWVDGKRDFDWYIVYAQIAEHLSKQGYTVFVSSHQVLRDWLASSSEKVVEIYPSHEIKEDWLRRLKYRLITDPSEKNKRAYEGALNHYDANIKSFEEDRGHYIYMELRTVNYKLEDVIDAIFDIDDLWASQFPEVKTPTVSNFYYTEAGNVFSMP